VGAGSWPGQLHVDLQIRRRQEQGLAAPEACTCLPAAAGLKVHVHCCHHATRRYLHSIYWAVTTSRWPGPKVAELH
jgi:hypothetical protein